MPYVKSYFTQQFLLVQPMNLSLEKKLLTLCCLMLTLSGCGGGGVNSPPVLVSVGDQQLFEGADSIIATLSATDSDGDALTFSVSGTDASSFTISASKQLSFISMPDFEAPTDADQDNVYSFTVSVSDGASSDSESISITVLDALEGRVVDGPVSGGSVVITGASGDVTEGVRSFQERTTSCLCGFAENAISILTRRQPHSVG